MIEDTSLPFLKGKKFKEIWFTNYPYPLDIENIIATSVVSVSSHIFGNLNNYLNKVAKIKKSGTLSCKFYNTTVTYNDTL